MARPTRFERVTFAFGGQRSFFEPNVGRSFRKPADLIAQTPTFGIAGPQVSVLYRRQNYDGTCSVLGVARAARYFAVEANGIGREVGTSPVLHELIRYCNAVPEKARCHRATTSDRLKNLK